MLDGLMNFYRTNAPFGSLNTAMSSGTLARMQNIQLASALASWPAIIEDLLEEEDTAGGLLLGNLYAKLGQMVSMRDGYKRRFSNPSGRVTDQVIAEVVMDRLTNKLVAPDYSNLVGNNSFAADLMYLMMMAQASEGEASRSETG